MLTVDNIQYRNLQEQVLQNKDDISIIKSQSNISDLGINIIQAAPLPTTAYLPTNYTGNYGDAYLVGTNFPYDLYIWTRSNTAANGYWFDWGPLNAPSTVPGPQGEQGEPGEPGTPGTKWSSGTKNPSGTANVGDFYLNTLTGAVFVFTDIG